MKLGILGGGQLARMLTLAAYPLGIHTLCLDPQKTACAGDVTQLLKGEFTDETLLNQFLAEVDCVTLETENIPLSTAQFVIQKKPLYPSIKALSIAQDRLHEKTFFQSLHIPTPPFLSVNDETELLNAVKQIGLPAVLKTRRFGYDGKCQYVLREAADIKRSWQCLGGNPLILEGFIDFEFEVSIIAVRNKMAEIAFYPLTHNIHHQGILRSSEAPFNNFTLQQEAQDIATRLLEELDYVGVLTIEFFYDGKQLIINEIAPRVHNSGHWTIEGAQTSQFENHIRAILNLPLGSTTAVGHCFLLNCIGTMLPLHSVLQLPGVHYHTYEKAPKPARKLGHVTLTDKSINRYQKNKRMLLKLLEDEVGEKT